LQLHGCSRDPCCHQPQGSAGRHADEGVAAARALHAVAPGAQRVHDTRAAFQHCARFGHAACAQKAPGEALVLSALCLRTVQVGWPLSQRSILSAARLLRSTRVLSLHGLLATVASSVGHMPLVQWYFLLRWPEGHVFSGEPLKLCFEDEDEAQSWRDALVTAVSGDFHGLSLRLYSRAQCPSAYNDVISSPRWGLICSNNQVS
jgi:hypothetical protein